MPPTAKKKHPIPSPHPFQNAGYNIQSTKGCSPNCLGETTASQWPCRDSQQWAQAPREGHLSWVSSDPHLLPSQGGSQKDCKRGTNSHTNWKLAFITLEDTHNYVLNRGTAFMEHCNFPPLTNNFSQMINSLFPFLLSRGGKKVKTWLTPPYRHRCQLSIIPWSK